MQSALTPRPSLIRRPRAGRVFLVAVALLLAAGRAVAQADTAPLITARQFLGSAVRDGAAVRSNPDAGAFAVTTLGEGQQVAVVGVSDDKKFLRILPPDGTFCLAPKAGVNLRGEVGGDRIGRVTDKLSLRVGTTLGQAVDAIALRLNPGDEVQVIGEDSQYYHVTPPKTVFFYVDQADLARVREVAVSETARGWKVGELPAAATPTQSAPQLASQVPAPEPTVTQTPPRATLPPAEPQPAQPVATGRPTGPDVATLPPSDDDGGTSDRAQPDTSAAASPTAPPAADVPDAADAPANQSPATKPNLAEAFKTLDARYVDSAAKPLEAQPLAELRGEYESLLAAAKTDPAGAAITPVIEARLKTLEIRQEALGDLESIQAMREAMVKRQRALEAEQDELASRKQQGNVTMYAAVGQLQPSSLQAGQGALYRLCDPATGRTLIYLRATGDAAAALARSLEQFVGVQGEVVTDGELDLKYVKVTKVDAVQPSQLFETVAAELIPPSLVKTAPAVN